MTSLRILIADDYEVVRRGVQALLESRPGWKVVGEAATGREALEKAKQLQPDITILDIAMPELNGVEATRQILNHVPRSEVLVLTMHQSESLIQKVLSAGAHGYVAKSDVARHLVDGVEALGQHKVFFAPGIAATVLEGYLKGSGRMEEPKGDSRELTSREREVLQLLAEGKSSKEVASALGIAFYTAQTHRNNIMRKLDLHSLSELIRYAIRNHMLGA